MDDLKENPFSALFPSLSVAKSYKESQQVKPVQQKLESSPSKIIDGIANLSDEEMVKDVQELNSLIEEIFLFTLNKFSVVGGHQKQLVHLSSLAEIIGKYLLIILQLNSFK